MHGYHWSGHKRKWIRYFDEACGSQGQYFGQGPTLFLRIWQTINRALSNMDAYNSSSCVVQILHYAFMVIDCVALSSILRPPFHVQWPWLRIPPGFVSTYSSVEIESQVEIEKLSVYRITLNKYVQNMPIFCQKTQVQKIFSLQTCLPALALDV